MYKKSRCDVLNRRLAVTRWARLPQGVGWERGTDAEFLANLLEFSRHSYDWRTHESRILKLPLEVAGVGDRALRVVNQRVSLSGAPVVVLLHGRPDSVLRFERVLHLLDEVRLIVP